MFHKLANIPAKTDVTDTFYGLDRGVRIADGEWSDEENLTSAHYPCMAPRPRRGEYPYPASATPVTHAPHGLIDKDALCYVDGATLYIDNYPVAGLTLTDTPKQLVSMGAYLLIFPDKKYVNTQNLTELGSMEASYTGTATVTYEMCDYDGVTYTGVTVSAAAPESPENGDRWIDTSVTPHELKQWAAVREMWINVATTYVKIKAPGIAAPFAEGDGVKITGIDAAIPQLAEALNGRISLIQKLHRSVGGGEDFITVAGILDTVATQSGSLTVSRRLPLMDFVIESENRLWGCRYGTDLDGNAVNEIYASKLGDFKNWNSFAGISTDSYVAGCGTDGPWTGAVTHLGYPLFFKENCMHKVYGSYPANFQIQTTVCQGVQKGAGRSLAIVGSTLFYKSRGGVCAYDGSLPQLISAAWGDETYSGVDTTETDPLRCGAVGGAHGKLYFLSAKSDAGAWQLLTFDTARGLWHKEDATRADGFCSSRGEMYFIDRSDAKIKTVYGSGTLSTDAVEWFAETGILSYPAVKSGRVYAADKKVVSRVWVGLTLPAGSVAVFKIQYDSCGRWEKLCALQSKAQRCYNIPIRPRRCDHFKLRIEGVGDARLHYISKATELGSDG